MKLKLLVLIAICGTGHTAHAESNSGYLDVSIISRQHNYDFDLTFDGTRYTIDESFDTGYRLSAGWSFGARWDIFVDYTRHEGDTSDGVIVQSGGRFQAPITYEYFRGQIGVRYSLPLTNRLRPVTAAAYQEVRQGIGNFFISNGNIGFGLDTSKQNYGWNGELGLRLDSGQWQYSVSAGYDPHAGFKISADGAAVESSAYGALAINYQFAENWRVGLDASHGKVTDIGATISLLF